jgi:hypothetical protein
MSGATHHLLPVFSGFRHRRIIPHYSLSVFGFGTCYSRSIGVSITNSLFSFPFPSLAPVSLPPSLKFSSPLFCDLLPSSNHPPHAAVETPDPQSPSLNLAISSPLLHRGDSISAPVSHGQIAVKQILFRGQGGSQDLKLGQARYVVKSNLGSWIGGGRGLVSGSGI